MRSHAELFGIYLTGNREGHKCVSGENSWADCSMEEVEKASQSSVSVSVAPAPCSRKHTGPAV